MKSQVKSFFRRIFPISTLHPFTKPDLYLHIGIPKTGTTSIQSFLFLNRQELQDRQGIYYPDNILHWNQHVPVVKAIVSSCFSHVIFNENIQKIDPDLWVQDVVKKCTRQKFNKVIISSEFLWASPSMQSTLEHHANTPQTNAEIEEVIKQFKDLFLKFHNVKVVIYLRRQDKWLESFFNQQIKDGFSIPQESDLLPVKIYLLYFQNIALWIQYFGRENVIVRPFEDANFNVVEDFCNVVGIVREGLSLKKVKDTESANISLPIVAVGIMRKAIDKKLDPDKIIQLRELLSNPSVIEELEDIKTQHSLFANEFHSKILQVYQADNEQLARLYPSFTQYLEQSILYEDTAASTNVASTLDWEEQIDQKLEELLAIIKS